MGDEGTGTLSVSGTGTVNCGGGLRVGNAFTANGTVNLNAGGTIVAALIESAGGAGTWNFNGGTLRARDNADNLMQGLTNAYVEAGGAVIDTDGYSATIAQPLVDGGGGGGLIKNSPGVLTLAGNINYSGTTVVNDGQLIMSGQSVSIGSASILGGSLQVNSFSATMHDISGGALIVGDGSSAAQLTADSIAVDT